MTVFHVLFLSSDDEHTILRWMDKWMTCKFMSFLLVFLSYQDGDNKTDGWMTCDFMLFQSWW